MIAIDGPAGSGKSTTARLVARKLGFTYLDTGALYRTITLLALQRGIDLNDGDALSALSKQVKLRVEADPNTTRIWVDGTEVTEAIRMPEVTRAVSQVARHPAVRREMVHLQRQIASGGNYVVEGRDIGTVVFPDADLKIFLIASLEARTRRRQLELQQKGIDISFEALKNEIMQRDQKDQKREIAPLKKAENAIVIDTTDLTIEEQANKIVEAFQKLETQRQ
ncbi:MAG: (d)CMP kinase [Calditrichaeota bacterium]|nr:MAG: (d)CMP kinase [Calditrichota bacterium]